MFNCDKRRTSEQRTIKILEIKITKPVTNAFWGVWRVLGRSNR